MTLVQVSHHRGVVKRVPVGDDPFVEMLLLPGQRIIHIRWHQLACDAERKTRDWSYEAETEWRDPTRETEDDVTAVRE